VPATSELGQVFDHKQTTRGHATIGAVDPKPSFLRTAGLGAGVGIAFVLPFRIDHSVGAACLKLEAVAHAAGNKIRAER
jgi:hypothetical protein